MAELVEGDGLENRCAGNRTGGSNPSLSAKHHIPFSPSRRLLFIMNYAIKLGSVGFGLAHMRRCKL